MPEYKIGSEKFDPLRIPLLCLTTLLEWTDKELLVVLQRLPVAAQQERYPAYVKHSEAALEWAKMSSEPILCDCEYIVDSSFGWLILTEK